MCYGRKSGPILWFLGRNDCTLSRSVSCLGPTVLAVMGLFMVGNWFAHPSKKFKGPRINEDA